MLKRLSNIGIKRLFSTKRSLGSQSRLQSENNPISKDQRILEAWLKQQKRACLWIYCGVVLEILYYAYTGKPEKEREEPVKLRDSESEFSEDSSQPGSETQTIRLRKPADGIDVSLPSSKTFLSNLNYRLPAALVMGWGCFSGLTSMYLARDRVLSARLKGLPKTLRRQFASQQFIYTFVIMFGLSCTSRILCGLPFDLSALWDPFGDISKQREMLKKRREGREII